jgi:hypothetical protein
MKIKFTWGTGIFIVIIIFISVFAAFAIFSMSLDINLVSSDYYDKEVAYEFQIQKIKNTASLSEKVKIGQENQQLSFIFPKIIKGKKITAKVQMYCYTDRHQDLTFQIQPDSSFRAFMDCKILKKGRYAVKLDWKIDEKSYYQEKDFSF